MGSLKENNPRLSSMGFLNFSINVITLEGKLLSLNWISRRPLIFVDAVFWYT
jgi:hypothetical protein